MGVETEAAQGKTSLPLTKYSNLTTGCCPLQNNEGSPMPWSCYLKWITLLPVNSSVNNSGLVRGLVLRVQESKIEDGLDLCLNCILRKEREK